MKIETLHTIVFSPTGTSCKIAEATARGFAAARTLHTDVTKGPVRATFTPSDTVLFALPVYGGKVAPAALKRIEAIRGQQTPALLVVVYGNRAFGKALEELAAEVTKRGFMPIAAAAFVGEHSYSTPDYPIAAGRPDSHDLSEAEAFGRAAAQRLTQGVEAIDVRDVRQPSSGLWPLLRFIWFVIRLRRQQKRHPVRRLPMTDPDLCTQCGACTEHCPTQAIAPGDELHTDPERCIRCCACVKVCPAGARTYDTPFGPILSRNFSRPKPNVFLPRS